jgi:hypothetical protein
VTAALTFAFLFVYYLLPPDLHSRNYNLTLLEQTDEAIQRGERFPINKVARIEEDEVFLEYATNVLYYEPLFSRYDRIRGYELEGFAAHVRPGEIVEPDGSYYNITNPASLVFPAENNLLPFERIKIGEEEQLQAFIRRGQPHWEIPTTQFVLDWLSLGIFALTVTLLIVPARLLTFKGRIHNLYITPPTKP